MQANNLTGTRVLERFMGTDQSNGNTGLEGSGVVLNIIHTMMFQGSGWTEKGSCRTRIFLELSKWLAEKRCAITTIDNTDNTCMARSIVVAKAHYKYVNQPTTTPEEIAKKKEYATKLKIVRDPRSNKQRNKALLLSLHAGVNPYRPCGIPEAQKFQTALQQKGYKIVIFSAEANFDAIFVGPDTCTKHLPILHYKHHYVVLTSMAAFFNDSHFCWNCHKGV